MALARYATLVVRSVIVLACLLSVAGCWAFRDSPAEPIQAATFAWPELPPEPILRAETPVAVPSLPEVRSHLVWAMTTGYCPCRLCCGAGAHGVTSTGAHTSRYPYGIAADPRLLPYGTQVQVPGYLARTHPGEFWFVDDTGAAMRNDGDEGVLHIDLRFKDHATARRWGVRWLQIEVLEQ